MEFTGPDELSALVPDVEWPTLHLVRQSPLAPTCDPAAAGPATTELPLDRVPAGGTVAVGLGSRGIADIVSVARAVVDALREEGLEPVVVPAMGSHGGGTPAGQREALAGLGLTPEALCCPIDDRVETTVVGRAGGEPVHVADAALAADGVLVVNRVKPHTSFVGRVESGCCKMATVGLGKQPGAGALHRRAARDGFETAILDALAAVREAVPLLGGVGLVENPHGELAAVEGLPVAALPDAEITLLDRAREHLLGLPIDDVDVLVVDRMGKDVSGTGIDPNVTGRYGDPATTSASTPDVERIVARGLTPASHGNANGIGLVDVTTTAVLEDVDLSATYANALTSGALSKVRLPMALPDEASALAAAIGSVGTLGPEGVRLVWIRDTGSLATIAVSDALRDTVASVPATEIGGPVELDVVADGRVASPLPDVG